MNALILDALRTPIGRFRGGLKDVRPDDLAAQAIAQLVARTRVPVEMIDDVILGCANQAGEDNRNVARMALLLAGLPVTVPGVTVNRLCGSGLEAVLTAARAIAAGEAELVIAGGVESMTRAPWVMPKASAPWPYGNVTVYDSALGWRFPNERMKQLFPLEAMGETAENLADRYQIGRVEQDAFALTSHQRALLAERGGHFAEERVAVTVGDGATFAIDEGVRPDTTMEQLAALRPAFRSASHSSGSVTAGNSSGLNDGAAVLLIASPACAARLGQRPLARVVAGAVAGVDPRYMGLGPVPATRRALERAGWSLGDVELAELNEAFAVQALSVLRELPLSPERVNVNGGAIALGHPLGCSGARIATTLVHAMRRRHARRGLCAMCVGVGQGIAGLFELV